MMSSPFSGGLPSILDYLSETIRERVIFQSDHDPDAIALWIVGTYLMDHWSRFPKLLVVSPERECGKTTALETIEALVSKGKMTSSITTSALYRYIEHSSPTLLIDEADLILKNNEELRAIINAGHTRRGAIKLLSDSTKNGSWVPKEMSLWCGQAIAGIGPFDDTLVSRSISIGLRRKDIREEITYLDDWYFDRQSDLRTSLLDWSQNIDLTKLLTEPLIPKSIGNRKRDNWLPCLQIAHMAGEQWVEKCFDAIEELEIKRKEDASVFSVNDLLFELREFLHGFRGSEICSSDLLKSLLNQPDSDWHSANHGRAITSKWLAQKLHPYSISPRHRRTGNVYLLAEFEDAFKRYLPPVQT